MKWKQSHIRKRIPVCRHHTFDLFDMKCVLCVILKGNGPNGQFNLTSLQIISVIGNEPVHEISNNVVCATSKGLDQPAHTRSLIRAFASRVSTL